MKKYCALAAFLFLFVLAVGASTTTFVYKGSISSTDMTSDVRKGQIYTDGSSNVLVVKSVHDGVTEFDKVISRGDYFSGNSLKSRGPLHSIGLYSGLYHSLVCYSVSCAIYPFFPVVMGGFGYNLVSAFKGGSLSVSDGLALAGVGVSFPLARLWNTKNTLIENGKITAWCAAGVSISSSVTFASSYGFSYRHNLGTFHWDLGAMWLYRNGGSNRISPYLGVGVDI